MSVGSNKLTLAEPARFQVGDPIIVETGGESGTANATYTCSGSGTNSTGNAGARGSVGVGGVWPQTVEAVQ